MKKVKVIKLENGLGIKIPKEIIKKLNIKQNDKLIVEGLDNSICIRKKDNISVREILCNFYGKNIDEIFQMNISESNSELDWGNDLGFELI